MSNADLLRLALTAALTAASIGLLLAIRHAVKCLSGASFLCRTRGELDRIADDNAVLAELEDQFRGVPTFDDLAGQYPLPQHIEEDQ